MSRRQRCVVEDVPHHVTQRGVDRCPVFRTNVDRATYLRLLCENLAEAQVRLLGWCLMTNHVHLVVVPQWADSLAVLFRRVHGRYAQYFNVVSGRTGHLWQNRYFACPLSPSHVWRALVYVDCNPVRAGMVEAAADYPWSSAKAHVSGADPQGLLNVAWWQSAGMGPTWHEYLCNTDHDLELEQCTYAGRPMGEAEFVARISDRFGRKWMRGRPRKESSAAAMPPGGSGNVIFSE